LYVAVRCFSFAKDIVNKYKLSEGVKWKKALRKDLKKASSELE
jgi:DNA-directed RNA polymerase subunit N (RpoN/RPB10)